MTIAFNCPSCMKGYQVPDTVAGRSSRCKQCGAALVIPYPNGAPMAVAVSAAPVAAFADSPPPRKKKFPVVFAMIGSGLVLSLVATTVMAYVAYSLLFGSSGLGAGVKFLPANTQSIVSIRVEDIMASESWKELKAEIPDFDKGLDKMETETGVALSNISHVLIGANPPGDKGAEDMVIVLQLKKSITAEDLKIKELANAKEVKVGNYTMREDGVKTALCIVDGKLVVVGPRAAVRSVLERDKKPEFAPGLETALKTVDLKQGVVFAGSLKDGVSKNPALSGVIAQQPQLKQLKKALDTVQYTTTEIGFGPEVKITSKLVCSDPKVAEDLRKMADGGITMVKNLGVPQEVADLLDSIKITDKDGQVTASVQFKVSTAAKIIKDLGKPANKTFTTVGDKIGGGPPGP